MWCSKASMIFYWSSVLLRSSQLKRRSKSAFSLAKKVSFCSANILLVDVKYLAPDPSLSMASFSLSCKMILSLLACCKTYYRLLKLWLQCSAGAVLSPSSGVKFAAVPTCTVGCLIHSKHTGSSSSRQYREQFNLCYGQSRVSILVNSVFDPSKGTI